jgi:hypothetical protein
MSGMSWTLGKRKGRKGLTLSKGASSNPFKRIAFNAAVFALGANGKSGSRSLFATHVLSLVAGS